MIKCIDNYSEYLELLPRIQNINGSKHYMQDFEWYILKDGKDKIDKFAVVGYDNDKVIYYCNIFIKSKKNIAYAPRGPIIDFCNKKHLDIFVADMKKFLMNINYEKFIMSPMIFECNNQDITLINNRYIEQEHSKKECIVDVIPFDNSPMESVDKKCAYSFRKALKNNFQANISNKINNLDEFYELYKKTSERHGFNRNTLTYFETLVNCFKDSIYSIIIRNGDKIISYGLYIWKEDTFYYLYGATDYSYSAQKASYYMHYNAILFCKENKIKYFNMGGVYADDEEINSKDFGLLRYKKILVFLPSLNFTSSVTEPTIFYDQLLYKPGWGYNEGGYVKYGNNNYIIGNKKMIIDDEEISDNKKIMPFDKIMNFMDFPSVYFDFYNDKYPRLKIFN